MSTIEKALQIAARAHEGQVDKEGLPYVDHVLRVMSGVEGAEARIAAVLHDVIEDTSVTADDLRQAGFSEAVLEAVDRLTHRDDESYAEYVVRCNGNAMARQIKLADLEDNYRLSRAVLRPDRIEPDLDRVRKYLLAYKYLTGMLSEDQYRSAMEGSEG